MNKFESLSSKQHDNHQGNKNGDTIIEDIDNFDSFMPQSKIDINLGREVAVKPFINKL